MILIKKLLEFSDHRGSLYVTEENKKHKFNYKYYYIINSNSIIDLQHCYFHRVLIIVIKGQVKIRNKKIISGEAIFLSEEMNEMYVSKEFFGIILSLKRLDMYRLKRITDVPFDVKRVFFVSNIPVGSIRGQHAHKTEKQYLICLNGLIDIKLTSEKKVISKRLTDLEAIYLPPMFWTEIINLKYNSIIPVFASSNYLQEEYITNIEDIY
jgi:dTDP-4-dehydrorhamnose 3,5-epimerase-like enzyme